MLGLWAGLGRAGLGWATLKQKLVYLKKEIGLFENGKVSLHRKNVLPHGQQQQAILFISFLRV